MSTLPEIDDTEPPMRAPVAELQAWLQNLQKRPKTQHVRDAIAWAKERIAYRQALDADTEDSI